MKGGDVANVAILVDNYFEQVELTEPKIALETAGHAVTVVTTHDDVSLTGLNHLDYGDEFEADKLIAEVRFEDYDAVVVPGGVVNADKLRMDERAREWMNYCMDHEIPLAVICHGPWLLVSAGVARDHTMTSYYTLQDDIRNAGGAWVDQEVVEDDALITSRNPDDLAAFSSTLLARLG